MIRSACQFIVLSGVCAAIAAADDDASQKKIVSMGPNNASIVAEKIQPMATESEIGRQNYLLALYHTGASEAAVGFYESIDPQSVTKAERMVYARSLLDLNRTRDAYIQVKAMDDPKNPDLKLELIRARILIRMKEWKAARAVLEMLVRVAPDDPEAHYYYALTCPTVGDYKGAVAHCNKVWELVEPNSQLARRAGALMLVSIDKLDGVKETK